jgi:Na+/H+-translocating membrane pyrophosphatase
VRKLELLEGLDERNKMNSQSGKSNAVGWTAVEGAVLAIGIGAFFFDIVGVFGLLFAIAGMLIAVALIVAICLKRPVEDQVQ